jgi:hypothetical protein
MTEHDNQTTETIIFDGKADEINANFNEKEFTQ